LPEINFRICVFIVGDEESWCKSKKCKSLSSKLTQKKSSFWQVWKAQMKKCNSIIELNSSFLLNFNYKPSARTLKWLILKCLINNFLRKLIKQWIILSGNRFRQEKKTCQTILLLKVFNGMQFPKARHENLYKFISVYQIICHCDG